MNHPCLRRPFPWPRPAVRVVGVLASLLFCLPLQAWPGYEFRDWQEVTTWTPPHLASDQAGKHALSRLLVADDGTAINAIQTWEAKRSRTAAIVRSILGEPTNLTRPKLEVETLDTEILEDHIRRHIKIRTEQDDWIPAYLLLHKPLPASPVPAMICLHQTVAQGKKEPCGMEGSEDLAFALQLVRRGYVCIAPDMIGFGERIPAGTQPYHDSIAFYRRHPNWSFMGKMIWDVSRVVDYLETVPDVDSRQIGSIGHSHGAYTTLFATAFEPRISLAIASCGFTTFRHDPVPNRWSHLTALIPQLGTYLPDVESIPFDWQHICSQIAPRPLFVWYGLHDTIFPNTEHLDELFQDVRTVYGLYGSADDLAWHAFDGAHGFPDHGRKRAYAWLDRQLRAKQPR
ncbi:MAG: alpha/beta hydrolase family protein [Pirellulales bacterium]